MTTAAQLGYGRIKRSDSTFTFTTTLDLNDQSQIWLGGEPSIGAPPLKTSWIGNYATDGAALAASSYDNRTLTIPIRVLRNSTDNMMAKFSDLLKYTDPSQGWVPPDDATYTYLPMFHWLPDTSTKDRYYVFFRSQPPALFDGRDRALYRVVRLNDLGGVMVTLTCLPYAYGASQVL